VHLIKVNALSEEEMGNDRDSNEGEQSSDIPQPIMSFLRVSSATWESNGGQQDPSSRNEGLEDPLLEDDLTSSFLPPSPQRRRLVSQPSWQSARQVIRRMGDYLAYCTLLVMLILIPIVLYRALRDRELDQAAFNSARVMVCGTVILSVRLVYLHLTHWYMPDVQKYVVRILYMVPVYAIQSWLSLLFHESRIYISSFRDFYEAYVIASFVYYLIALLGGQDALVQLLRHKAETQPNLGEHAFPLSLILQRWELGADFLLQCKHGALQYVVFKSISTTVTFICEFAGVYGEGEFSWFVAYPYLCFFQNISVMYALYSLVMLYSAVNEELRHPINWHPLGKFLCIKGVVFFTWWQGVIIFYLRAHGIIEDLGTWTSEDVANGLIDYCIVVEMIGFAIAHSYTFTYKEYLPSNLPPEASQHQQQDIENGNEDEGNGESRARSHYRPPAALNQPMKFKDAFWSSTVPKETLEDIQRLRNGVDSMVHEATRDRAISLQELTSDHKE